MRVCNAQIFKVGENGKILKAGKVIGNDSVVDSGSGNIGGGAEKLRIHARHVYVVAYIVCGAAVNNGEHAEICKLNDILNSGRSSVNLNGVKLGSFIFGSFGSIGSFCGFFFFFLFFLLFVHSAGVFDDIICIICITQSYVRNGKGLITCACVTLNVAGNYHYFKLFYVFFIEEASGLIKSVRKCCSEGLVFEIGGYGKEFVDSDPSDHSYEDHCKGNCDN